jgi:two-component system chemotaxis sensor kinase CheA
LNAFHQGGRVVIEVRDDGRGLDASVLIAKAVEKGLLTPGAKLSDAEAYQLIFASGFSTKTEVTEVSGRGVGLDIVRANIKELQGSIRIETSVGRGCCFRLVLPLTMSIIDGMIVRVGEERFVVPLSNISESVRPKRDDVIVGANAIESIRLRGETMPAFKLGDLLGRPGARQATCESIALVVRELKEKPFSLLVDDIVGSQQVVVKPLGQDLNGLPGIAGGTILGDGQAALILDVDQIIEASV